MASVISIKNLVNTVEIQPTKDQNFLNFDSKVHCFAANFLKTTPFLFVKEQIIRGYSQRLILKRDPVNAFLHEKTFCKLSDMPKNNQTSLENDLINCFKCDLQTRPASIKDLEAITVIDSFIEELYLLPFLQLSPLSTEQLLQLDARAKEIFSNDLYTVFTMIVSYALSSKSPEANEAYLNKAAESFNQKFTKENTHQIGFFLAKAYIERREYGCAYQLIYSFSEPFRLAAFRLLIEKLCNDDSVNMHSWVVLFEDLRLADWYSICLAKKIINKNEGIQNLRNLHFYYETSEFDVYAHLFVHEINKGRYEEALSELKKLPYLLEKMLEWIVEYVAPNGYREPKKILAIFDYCSFSFGPLQKKKFLTNFFFSFETASQEKHGLSWVKKLSDHLSISMSSISKGLLTSWASKGSLKKALDYIEKNIEEGKRDEFYLSLIPFLSEEEKITVKDKVNLPVPFFKPDLNKNDFQAFSLSQMNFDGLQSYYAAMKKKALLENQIHYLIAEGSFDEVVAIFHTEKVKEITPETWEKFAATFLNYLEAQLRKETRPSLDSNDNNNNTSMDLETEGSSSTAQGQRVVDL